ncbi:MAG: hypothetical protein LBN26_09860 [Christensenellaceae bacterium]|jgi:hypothetical protein|nr:hypothetical protein [Christensenellaceae bacterium]
MYHSPVPLIIIRADCPALIEVNGQMLGECTADTHVALPASDTGDYYVSVIPLRPEEPRWAVTRKVRFEGGLLTGAPAADVSICSWPGGVYEMCMHTGQAALRHGAGFPRTLDQLSYSIGNHRRTLTLYYEGGLRLCIEDGGKPRTGIALGEGSYGTLAVYTTGGRQFAAVRTADAAGEQLLMLDNDLNAALEIAAAHITLEEDGICAIDPIGTLLGHERRIRYSYSAGAFVSAQPETGFFTCAYARPAAGVQLATAFCEAVREGFEQEAIGYLAPELEQAFNFDEIKDFLGDFQHCRPPLSDQSGTLLGLIAQEEDRLSSARLYAFTFEDGLIADIAEV